MRDAAEALLHWVLESCTQVCNPTLAVGDLPEKKREVLEKHLPEGAA